MKEELKKDIGILIGQIMLGCLSVAMILIVALSGKEAIDIVLITLPWGIVLAMSVIISVGIIITLFRDVESGMKKAVESKEAIINKQSEEIKALRDKLNRKAKR